MQFTKGEDSQDDDDLSPLNSSTTSIHKLSTSWDKMNDSKISISSDLKVGDKLEVAIRSLRKLPAYGD